VSAGVERDGVKVPMFGINCARTHAGLHIKCHMRPLSLQHLSGMTGATRGGGALGGGAPGAGGASPVCHVRGEVLDRLLITRQQEL
jgi:hypothetical protein